MKLSEYLNRSVKENNVNESLILGGMIGMMCVASAVSAVANTDFVKNIGTGFMNLLSGIGTMFGRFGSKKDDNPKDDNPKGNTPKGKKDDEPKGNTPKGKKDDEPEGEPEGEPKEPKGKKDDEPKIDSNMLGGLMLLASKANEQDKDETRKKKTGALLDLLAASSYDADGNEIPVEERMEKLKDMVGEDNWETFKKDMEETYKENKDSDEFKEALENAKKNIKESDVETYLEETKKRAKTTLEQVAKEKEKQDKVDKEIKELKEKMGDAEESEVDKLKKELKKLQEERAELLKNSVVGVASPATAEAAIKAGNKDNDTEGGEDEPKKDDEPKKEDEPKKSADDIEKEYKEKSKELEKEYQEKIDKEEDKDKKKELEDEWEKKEAKLSAEKNKQLDSIDDNDEHDTEKDETKQGKYKVKDEEVTDPETGKKIKVKTFTGPRGGKFYYPEGKPKTPENKVYVESEIYTSLSSYLYEKFNA